MTEDRLLTYKVAELERQVKDLHLEIAAIERRNAERDQERTQQERKQLLAGISFLGAMVMALLSVIWSFRGVIFRGTP